MKVKALIFTLMLIGIFICLPNQNQAYVGPPYYDPLEYPNEHPWQDLESPPSDDINHPEISSIVLIIGFPTKIIMIRTSQAKSEIKSDIEVSRQTPEGIEFGYPTTKGND